MTKNSKKNLILVKKKNCSIRTIFLENTVFVLIPGNTYVLNLIIFFLRCFHSLTERYLNFFAFNSWRVILKILLKKIFLIVNKFLIRCYLVLPVVCSVWGLQQDLIIFDSKAQSTRNCQWGTVIKVEGLNWFNQEIHQNQGRRHESWLHTHIYQSLTWLRINIMIKDQYHD